MSARFIRRDRVRDSLRSVVARPPEFFSSLLKPEPESRFSQERTCSSAPALAANLLGLPNAFIAVGALYLLPEGSVAFALRLTAQPCPLKHSSIPVRRMAPLDGWPPWTATGIGSRASCRSPFCCHALTISDQPAVVTNENDSSLNDQAAVRLRTPEHSKRAADDRRSGFERHSYASIIGRDLRMPCLPPASSRPPTKVPR